MIKKIVKILQKIKLNKKNLWDNIKDHFCSSGSDSTSFFHQEGHRGSFIQISQLRNIMSN